MARRQGEGGDRGKMALGRLLEVMKGRQLTVERTGEGGGPLATGARWGDKGPGCHPHDGQLISKSFILLSELSASSSKAEQQISLHETPRLPPQSGPA
jgi:hypothetical protein